jgi:hypothetical protein
VVALGAACAVVIGCSTDVTRDDIADAEQQVREEQQDVAEAQRDATQAVREERQEARDARHEVNRPILGEDPAEARGDVAEARREGQEEVAEQKAEAREAEQELDATKARFNAQQARDTYVSEARGKLEAADKQIEQIRARGDNLEGDAKDAHDKTMDEVDALRKSADEAVDDVESADALKWTESKGAADVAMKNLAEKIDALK